jgi:DNA-binding response OmpR family regulator
MSRVLLIEDDPSVREMLAFFLRASRHDVRVAPSLEHQTEAEADCAIIDTLSAGMPDPTMEALGRLASVQIPVIALSTRHWSDRLRNRPASLAAVLDKPFRPSTLLAAVEDATAGRRPSPHGAAHGVPPRRHRARGR